MADDDTTERNDFLLKGKYACTLWVLLRAGKIKSIIGLDDARQDKSVVHIVQRFIEGDEVLPSMVGNEKQVLARIYIVTHSKDNLLKKIKEIESKLSVNDECGNDMIIELLDVASISGKS